MLVGIISFYIPFFRSNSQHGFAKNSKAEKTELLRSMRFLHRQWECGEISLVHAPV